MRRHRPTTLLIAILALPVVAVAQPGPGFDGRPGGPLDPDGRFAEHRLEVITDYLDLSDAQSYEWRTLSAEQREARVADSKETGAEHQALRALLESDSPDPAEVGRQVIEMHSRQQALRVARDADIAALKTILTPDQVERFDALMTARSLSPRIGERGPRGHLSRHRHPADADTEAPE